MVLNAHDEKDRSPYPGLSSFRWQDRHDFFGRSVDSSRLQNQVLNNRLSLLHAPSGAGKTSLINAGILANLEQDHGWIATVARPGQHPLIELRRAIVHCVFPPPSAELTVIRNLLKTSDAMSELNEMFLFGHHQTLSDIRRTTELILDRLKSDPSPRIRHFCSIFIRSALDSGPDGSSIEAMADSPVFHRFLDYVNGRKILARHLASFSVLSSEYNISLPWPNLLARAFQEGSAEAFGEAVARLPLSELLGFYESAELDALWRAFAGRHLMEGGEDEPEALSLFLEGIGADSLHYEVLGCSPGVSLASPPGMVVILDQFEELFTRFSHADRVNYFDQLEHTYQVGAPNPEGNSGVLSRIHFLISMRNEHVADLDRVRGFALNSARAALHLNFIPATGMQEAITIPAKQFGFAVDDAVVDQLIRDLVLEDDTVEPSLVQIVLSYVWSRFGEELSNMIRGDGTATLDETRYQNLGTTEVIMRRYLQDMIVLAGDKGAPEEEPRLAEFRRFELLDILDQLTRKGDFRVILSEEELMGRAPGSSGPAVSDAGEREDIRREMLEFAISKGLVRRHRQRGASTAAGSSRAKSLTFLEVTHERLIPGISSVLSEHIRQHDVLRHLQSGRARLQAMTLTDARLQVESKLSDQEIRTLNMFADHLQLDGRLLECLFRSALYLGVDRAVVHEIAQRLDAAKITVNTDSALRDASRREEAEQWLDRLELAQLQARGWPGAQQAQAFILKSLLFACRPEDAPILMNFGRTVSSWKT